MSPSAQETKSQIAEMREGLRSTRQSMKVGKAVGILAVIVGLAIVALYVNAFIQLGKRVVQSPRIPQIARQRVQQFQFDRTVRHVLEAAGPAYLEEAKALAEEMDLMQTIQEQAQLMLEDLRPVLRKEVQRIQPQIQQAIQAQGQQTLADLEGMLQDKIETRLTAILAKQSGRLAETGATREKLAEAVANLQEASLEAFQTALRARKGDLDAELTKFNALLEEIPSLREMGKAEIQRDLRDVLLALLKHKLPDYEFRGMGPAAERGAPPGRPAEVEEIIEKARDRHIPEGPQQEGE